MEGESGEAGLVAKGRLGLGPVDVETCLPPSARELRVVLGDAVLECREPRLLGGRAAVGIEVERLRGGHGDRTG